MLNSREIQDWLITRIAEQLHLTPGSVDIRESFSNYGLSSFDVVTLSGDLEVLLDRRLSPTLAYDYPSILSLSSYLAGDAENKLSPPVSNSSRDIAVEPIAVIGMGCRFPGAKDPASFWQLLCTGIDAITEVPPDRWDKNAFYNPDPSVPGKAISYWGGFLDNIDQFDPFFFGISPVEAKCMDPQQRLLLELSYEALDDAGQINTKNDGKKTGVFIGISANEYSHLQFSDPTQITSHSGTGNALSIAANRISYFFNFHGPSVAIDTACSSSLAAVHVACQSIRNGECEMALAGGVNMILSPTHSIAFTKAGVLAPDGRCKTFDAGANGYVRGEGAGVVVLKPLSSALADGDPVHALILGSAMGQDGRTNGLMAPSREAQEVMMRQAYKMAGILPGNVQYVEAHGTGTLLGDSMEAQAIGAVIGVNRVNGPCAIGSVKTNIGHLEAAAGIAGLIKVILSLKHRTIPPSIHYHSPNPHIPFDELNLRVHSNLDPWPSDSKPALAGVNSFGFGGTNVHMIVQEADNEKQDDDDGEMIHSSASHCHLLPLSANSYETLQILAAGFQEILASDFSVSTKDLCFAASMRRSQYDYRMAAIGNSRQELYSSLQAFVREEQDPDLFVGSMLSDRAPRLVFVFPGQGGQWYGMGRELLQLEPVFYQAIKRIDFIIQSQYGWSLMDEFSTEQSVSRLREIDVVQPLLFAIQVALAELWHSWGIKPDAVVGHSMGEVAAAHIAGILSLEDAIQVVCCRSQLLKQYRGQGSMMVTELSHDQAKKLLQEYDNDITIAAINSPTSTVLSGNPVTMKKVMDFLQSQNLFCKLVNVDVASHSPQMDHLRYELLEALAGLQPQSAKIPFYSTVTGKRGDDLGFNAGYWMDNLRKPVLFSDAIGQLLISGHTIFIEIGPHPILLGSIQQSLQPPYPEVLLLPSLRRDEREREVMLSVLCELYTKGFSISWNNLYPKGGKYVHLPPIPWQRQRYWMDTRSASSKEPWHSVQVTGNNSHPLLGEKIDLANSSYVWQTVFDSKVQQLLADHRVAEEVVFPAAAYIEMALQSAKEAGLSNLYVLSDFAFKESMILQNENHRSIQVLLSPGEEGSFLFNVYSRTGPEENWVQHASATFKHSQSSDRLTASVGTTPDLIRQQCTSQFTKGEFYKALQLRGLQYGASFQSIEHIWIKENESLGHIRLPGSLQNDTGVYQIHPALLDGCLQVLAALLSATFENDLYLPTGCKSIRFFSHPDSIMWSQVCLQSGIDPGTDTLIADIRLLDSGYQTVAELIGFRLQRSRRRIRRLLSRQDTWLYHVRWQVQEDLSPSPTPLKESRHWLVFADDEGLGDVLVKQLEVLGDHCHLLTYKKTIKKLDGAPDGALLEIIRLFVKEIPSPLYGVLHLWSLSIPPHDSPIFESTDITQKLGCNSALYLVQVLAGSLAGSPRLWLVTKGAQSVKPGEPIAIEQSPLWGLGKIISFELPELNCVRIDLDPNLPNVENVPILIKQILVVDREDQIAFRTGIRYVPRLLPFMLAVSSSPAALLGADNTYLITGGLGELGLVTAKWLVRRGARHLVLMGRSEPSSSAIHVIEQLRNEGAEVVTTQADVSDKDQLEEVFKNIEQHMPVLRGVIHAAGLLDDGSLLNLDGARMKNVMAPKVAGTRNLHHVTLNLPLDFFVLFSSAVSVLGSPGQGNYAAASSYLDAMAFFRRHLGLPGISINWGPWAEVGLAAEATERLKEQNASTQHLIKVIPIEQGLEILELLLQESTPQVAVLPFDLENLLELYPTAASMPFFAEVGGRNSHLARLYARPNLRQQYIAPRNEMESKLATLWLQTLHIDRVGINDSFFELGGDSVLAAQILSLTRKTYGISINPQDAFQAFTIKRLAEMLKAEILKQVEEMSEEEAESRLSKE